MTEAMLGWPICKTCDGGGDAPNGDHCPECGGFGCVPWSRRLTRIEQLEGLADRGCDTLEEARCER